MLHQYRDTSTAAIGGIIFTAALSCFGLYLIFFGGYRIATFVFGIPITLFGIGFLHSHIRQINETLEYMVEEREADWPQYLIFGKVTGFKVASSTILGTYIIYISITNLPWATGVEAGFLDFSLIWCGVCIGAALILIQVYQIQNLIDF